MRRLSLYLFSLLLLVSFSGYSQEDILRQQVAFLADSIGNRYPASEGDFRAQNHIAEFFADCDLQCDIQAFDIVEYIWGEGALQLMDGDNNTIFLYGDDFSVSGKSPTDTISAEYVVVTGNLPTPLLRLTRNKVVLCLQSPLAGLNERKLPLISDLIQAGAKAIIFVQPPGKNITQRLTKGNRSPLPERIPILFLNYESLSPFIPTSILDESKGNLYFASPEAKIQIATIHHDKHIQAANIIGLKRGNSDNYIIVGAHYDTCGPDPETGEIRPGANDNASGVAMLMALAKRLSGQETRHNFLFVAFSGEEKGLLGSLHFVENMPFQPEQVTEMINLDMVGRMTDNTLYYRQYHKKNEAPQSTPCIVLKNQDGGNSDHSEFARLDIPTSCFHTGTDPMIHTPGDTADRLNYEGMARILDFLTDYILKLD